jgi:hypothetical protein
MTLVQLHAYRLALRDKLHELNCLDTTCHGCEHFATGICAYFGETPPATFQRTPEACEAWVYDGVPF